MPTVVLVGTLDTKGREYSFLADRIREHGADVVLVDAGIVGERPSKGARSPSLWNAVFTAERLDLRFHPFDVDGPALPPLVAALKADPRFIGGSVAVPYKTAILGLLDRVEPVAARIGALAGSGEILVSSETIDGASVPYAVTGERSAELQGFKEPVPIAAVRWQ